MRRILVLSLSTALVALACKGDQACPPGAQVSCACIDNKQGVQICDNDGSSYGACDCGTGGSSSSSSASSGTAGAGGGGGDGGGCLTCGAWRADADASSVDICQPSLPLYDALADCTCLTGCSAECFSTTCSGFPTPPACASCIEASCATEVAACEADK